MMRIRTMIGALALAGAALAPVQGIGQVATSEAQQRQVGAEILFWSQAQRDANFPAMEKLFPGNTIKAAAHARALPAGVPLPIPAADVDAFMSSMNVAGLIVLQNGKVRLERYARGLTEQGRWTSFSVAKSFTSTLVGATLKDGYIKSIDPDGVVVATVGGQVKVPSDALGKNQKGLLIGMTKADFDKLVAQAMGG